MRALNLLIKPYSSGCNLRCKYCFYYDVADNRIIKNYGPMKFDVLEKLVKEAFAYADTIVNFMFQGGEPTLVGIEYYRKFHEYVEIYNKNNIRTAFFMQTNGTLLNKEWIELYKKYNYLIGISIDGYKEIHDVFRLSAKNKGTFEQVIKGAELLKNNNIEFNVLCVINKLVAENGKKVYSFFKEKDFRYMQFIPCIDSFNEKNENEDYTLTAKDYGIFLNDTFSLWYEDFIKGNFISIRYFDNLIRILLGEPPEACDMMGFCSVNGVVESNGDIYPCDFYVLDEYKIGNIVNDKFENILFSENAVKFYTSSLKMSEKCKKCKYLKICRSGCRRYKNFDGTENLYENKFCDAYMSFFGKNLEKLIEVAKITRKIRYENIRSSQNINRL
ncbi:anaerobic sulfatase maturase [Pseudoleptotrichia goodfellowii]|uniref:Anaerobic sulfatase maturase n=1 Tax=Pseudoleptotrichia goodfellowii F0264 TaxID=596323 RepID=D0GN22_9FUSO|nr:anaerobic sulfatase maturase [Pseudoleptotrichia goodfellowii]EEY34500.1 anaerobic sulfatase maturase [Pseudoleptotrichia goodfellowii F0264]